MKGSRKTDGNLNSQWAAPQFLFHIFLCCLFLYFLCDVNCACLFYTTACLQGCKREPTPCRATSSLLSGFTGGKVLVSGLHRPCRFGTAAITPRILLLLLICQCAYERLIRRLIRRVYTPSLMGFWFDAATSVPLSWID